MSTITRRFSLTATRETRDGQETITLGRGVEFDGKDLSIEVHVIPTGNWWSGVAMLTDLAGGDSDMALTTDFAAVVAGTANGRRFDLVAGKRAPGEERAKWLKVGFGIELVGGVLTLDFQHIPAGNWWDGRLRLFEQRADGDRPHRGLPRKAAR